MTARPGWIAPMLASAGPVPSGDRWFYEIKFDGVRSCASTGDDGLRLRSRNDRELSADYPELAELALEPGLLLDGEIVALDSSGVSDFELLQQRIHRSRPGPELRARVPVTLVVFDLLHRDREDLTSLPYERRRDALLELGLHQHASVQVPPSFSGISGEQMLAAADAQGLEGIVAKRQGSRYEPGRRSRSWIKTPIRNRTFVALIGWAPSSTSRRRLGALLLAVPDGHGGLRYAGDVGTGFDQAAREQLRELLEQLERPDPPVPLPGERPQRWRVTAPFSAVRWAEPVLIGEVAYRAVTSDGAFRHPSWQGLRPTMGLEDLSPPDP